MARRWDKRRAVRGMGWPRAHRAPTFGMNPAAEHLHARIAAVPKQGPGGRRYGGELKRAAVAIGVPYSTLRGWLRGRYGSAGSRGLR
jgi:hypothetical protein